MYCSVCRQAPPPAPPLPGQRLRSVKYEQWLFYSKACKAKKKSILKSSVIKLGRKGAQNFCPIQVEAFKCAVKVEVSSYSNLESK